MRLPAPRGGPHEGDLERAEIGRLDRLSRDPLAARGRPGCFSLPGRGMSVNQPSRTPARSAGTKLAPQVGLEPTTRRLTVAARYRAPIAIGCYRVVFRREVGRSGRSVSATTCDWVLPGGGTKLGTLKPASDAIGLRSL